MEKPTKCVHEQEIITPDGNFLARYSEKGLCELAFPTARATAGKASPDAIPGCVRSWHDLTRKALLAALAGHAPERLPPLDFARGTVFQQSVWKALGRIRHGRTTSYGELAREIGRPKAVRALGGACGANPIPVLVPCHRVLGAHNSLGGFSGGLDWKRKLLSREGSWTEAHP